jgi:RNA-directed DNA polymerase
MPPSKPPRTAGEDLWESLTSFENLWEAARRARRGKRFQHSAACFDRDLGRNLLLLLDELRSGEYRPGAYTSAFSELP